jgi:integrase
MRVQLRSVLMAGGRLVLASLTGNASATMARLANKTRQEVARRMAQALRDAENGVLVTDERQTVGQYLVSWLDVVKHQLEPGTYRRYRNFVQGHIIPILGKVVLSKLTAQQVQAMYSKVLDKGLSTTTVHHLHGAFHKALGDAFRLGLIQRNVTEMVQPPRRRHHEIMPLTKQQARKLLETVAGDRFEAVYVLALTTGMREGEIFALRWQDVDLDQSTLNVRATLKEAHKGREIGKTKTHTLVVALPFLRVLLNLCGVIVSVKKTKRRLSVMPGTHRLIWSSRTIQGVR